MSSMLHHNWNTQKTEALNESVSSYAPKDRTFSRIQYLHTRESIVGAVQVCGYLKLWSRIFHEFHIPMDDNFGRQNNIMNTVK